MSPTASSAIHAGLPTLTLALSAKASPGKTLKSWSVAWGDGTTSKGTGAPPATLAHPYASLGTYTTTFSVVDSGGGTAVTTLTAAITVMPPTPVQPPPVFPISPNCTRVLPGGASITLAGGAVWSLRADGATLLNGVWVGTGAGSIMENSAGSIQVLGTDNNWYVFTGTAWVQTGLGDPCAGPSPLAITCPTVAPIQSPDGDPVIVTFAASATGGTPPYTFTYSPLSGSAFPVGTTPVSATVKDSVGASKSCSFSVTVTTVVQPVGLYVDWVNGIDGGGRNGSIGQPWKTINFGVTQLSAANPTLIVRGDPSGGRGWVYAESLNNPAMPSGTSWAAPITIQAYPGETVWMQPPTPVVPFGWVIYVDINLAYLVFQGIHFDFSNATATNRQGGIDITVNPSTGTSAGFFKFQNCELLGNRIPSDTSDSATGFVLQGRGSNQILSCVIHGSGGATDNYGMYIQSPNNVVDSCEIYDVGYAGIQIYSQGISSIPANNLVRKCRIHDIVDSFNGNLSGIIIAGDNTLAYDNLIWNIALAGGFTGAQTGIQLFEGNGILIANNTIVNAGDACQANPGSGNTFENNLVWNAPAGAVNGVHYFSGGSATETTNSWQAFPGVDPKFVNPSTPDFHLQASSPAIGAGTSLAQVPDDLDGVARGNPPSVGAYET